MTSEITNFENAIGRLAMNFGALEVRLAAILEDLISREADIGRTVLAGRQFAAMARLLVSLVTAKAGENSQYTAEATRLAAKMSAVNEQRNNILHAAWLDQPGTDIHTIKTRLNRERGQVSLEPMTHVEILTAASKIHEASEELRAFSGRLRAAHLAADHSQDPDSKKFLSAATPSANSTMAYV